MASPARSQRLVIPMLRTVSATSLSLRSEYAHLEPTSTSAVNSLGPSPVSHSRTSRSNSMVPVLAQIATSAGTTLASFSRTRADLSDVPNRSSTVGELESERCASPNAQRLPPSYHGVGVAYGSVVGETTGSGVGVADGTTADETTGSGLGVTDRGGIAVVGIGVSPDSTALSPQANSKRDMVTKMTRTADPPKLGISPSWCSPDPRQNINASVRRRLQGQGCNPVPTNHYNCTG